MATDDRKRENHGDEQAAGAGGSNPRGLTLVLLGLPILLLVAGLALTLPALMRGRETAQKSAAALPAAQQTGAKPARTAPELAAQGNAGALSRDAAIRMVAPSTPWKTLAADAVLSRIAFGSCLDQRQPQPIWAAITKLAPQLFLMTGDNVYGDIKNPDSRELAEAYRRQLAHPEFQAARSAMPMLGIWDDHDYGQNDAGAGFAHRDIATALFRSYWQLPATGSDGDGVFYARAFGPEGRRVQVIMLDTRSHRAPFAAKPEGSPLAGKYGPSTDPSRTLLGDAQWRWLETELRKPADVRLVVSSIQVLSEGHAFERWGHLPVERERLMNLFRTTGATGVILLSGDRHSGAIYNRPLAPGQILIEITSSSLNRPYGPAKDVRTTELVSDVHHVENFGVIEIDWTARKVALSLRGLGGDELDGLTVKLSDLGPDAKR
jgi:alkaline phosphatase D